MLRNLGFLYGQRLGILVILSCHALLAFALWLWVGALFYLEE